MNELLRTSLISSADYVFFFKYWCLCVVWYTSKTAQWHFVLSICCSYLYYATESHIHDEYWHGITRVNRWKVRKCQYLPITCSCSMWPLAEILRINIYHNCGWWNNKFVWSLIGSAANNEFRFNLFRPCLPIDFEACHVDLRHHCVEIKQYLRTSGQFSVKHDRWYWNAISSPATEF